MKKITIISMMLSLLVSLHFVLAAGEEDDSDKTLQQAMEDAQKAAAKSGIKTPDMSKQLKEMEAENEKENEEEDKAEAASKKAAVHSPAVTSPLTALPAWIPAIPDFHPAPNAKKKQEDGVETGKITGTSSTAADAIADAWHTVAQTRKMSFERQDSNINGKKSVHVNVSDVNGGGGEVSLDLSPGKGSKIELSYKVKIPASPAAQ